MEEKDRPGGLTALAVINFIFAAISLFAAFSIFIGRMFIDHIPMDQVNETQAAGLAALQNMSGSTLATITGTRLIFFLLLLVSGIGYLKQKKTIGRILGSSYGVLAILNTLLSTTLLTGVTGQSFGVGSVIVLIYPVLTLILLNTVYKDDLVY